MMQAPPLDLTPEEFERHVRALLDAMGSQLEDYRSNHLPALAGTDGEYEVDVEVRFRALGGTFLVLVECKHHKSRIKREYVQVLNDKVRSLKAQKGMMFATGGFQSGAIEYAKANGIALVHVWDGRTCYMARARRDDPEELIPWSRVPSSIPPVVGWLQVGNTMSLLTEWDAKSLAEFVTAA